MPIIKLAVCAPGRRSSGGARKKRIIFNYLARAERIVIYLLNFV